MTKLTGKNSKWEWTESCQKAFEGLKADLTSSPVLASPDMDKHFEVVTDACCTGIGAVLMQEGRPIAFESRKLTDPETRYSTTEQELLASVHAMTIWRCYLEGLPKSQVTLVTDHHPNTCLPSQPTMNRRQARWSEFLQRFNFNWVYRPGRSNVADPVSRLPYVQQGTPATTSRLQMMDDSHPGAEISNTPLGTVDDLTVWPPQSLLIKGYTIDSCYSNQAGFTHDSSGLVYHDGRLVLPDALGIRQMVFEALHSSYNESSSLRAIHSES